MLAVSSLPAESFLLFLVRLRLEKACNQTKKGLEKIKEKGLLVGTQPKKRPHHISGWFKKVLTRVGLSSY
jgi:hypothetical protein